MKVNRQKIHLVFHFFPDLNGWILLGAWEGWYTVKNWRAPSLKKQVSWNAKEEVQKYLEKP